MIAADETEEHQTEDANCERTIGLVAAAGSDSCGPGSVRVGQWILALAPADHDVGLIGTNHARRAVA